MTLTPEGKTKARLKKLLKEHNAYVFMPVQGGYGASALDFIICHKGAFASVETKAGNKGMTPRQQTVASQIQAAGGAAFLFNDVTDGGLDAWLNRSVP